MPAAIAIPAIVGAVGVGANVVTGVMGANAAKSAAKTQADQAEQARQDAIKAAADWNPRIQTAAEASGKLVSDASGQAADDVTKAAADAGAGVSSATTTANGMLDPYIGLGSDAASTLRAALASGGDLNRSFTADDFKSLDPGYDFRLKQAQQAIERSQAARGASGGGALKELTRYSQDYASNEFQNAFGRFEQNGNDRFARLSGVAGLGLTASTTAGNRDVDAAKYAGDMSFTGTKTADDYRVGGATYEGNLNYDSTKTQANNAINAQKTASDYATQGAAAQAAGTVGASNAITGAIGGAANAVNGAINLRTVLKNPALSVARAPYYDPNGTTMNPDGSLTVRRIRG